MRMQSHFRFHLNATRFENSTPAMLILALTACATPVSNPSDTSNIAQLIASSCESPSKYALRALQWTDEARTKELERLAKSLDSSDEYCPVVELAIFLSIPSKKYQDDGKAVLLLKKLSKDLRLSKSEKSYVSQLLPHIQQRQNFRMLVDAQQTEILRLKQSLK